MFFSDKPIHKMLMVCLDNSRSKNSDLNYIAPNGEMTDELERTWTYMA
jgi:hypothetical protein